MSFLRKLSKRSSASPNSDVKSSIARNTRDVGSSPSRTQPTRRPQPQPQGVSAGEEAPPAYTPRSSEITVTPAAPVRVPTIEITPAEQQPAIVPIRAPATAQATTAGDSPYAFLTQFDTVFLIDDSGSMAGRSWRETAQALSLITPICTQHDADGIDIYFLNHRSSRTNSGLGGYSNVTTTAAVGEIFAKVKPSGGTPTGTRLNHILKPYLSDLENDLKRKGNDQETSIKPLNIIVITDGVPSDDVESVIVQAARKLDKLNAEPWQIGIQFFQVGQEPEAAEELRDLDDALAKQHNIRDMVDTVPWNGEEGAELSATFVLKVVMGSINRRLDRKSV